MATSGRLFLSLRHRIDPFLFFLLVFVSVAVVMSLFGDGSGYCFCFVVGFSFLRGRSSTQPPTLFLIRHLPRSPELRPRRSSHQLDTHRPLGTR